MKNILLSLLIDLNPSSDKYSIGFFVALAIVLVFGGIFYARALMRNKKKTVK